MSESRWPFDQPQNCAAISCRAVLFSGAPVLLVVHYSEDHSWAFLDGEDFRAEDGAVVSMERAVGTDSTLLEVADLPPGWVATREGIGGAWQRKPDPDV
jgi:hypothetical protein